MEPRNANRPLIFTIGHSTRPLEEFIGILKAQGVVQVADVRTVPRSRHNPQYNLESLPENLEAAGLGYLHLAGLGGLRRPKADSLNGGWRNASFRGFADYMQTPAFAAALEELVELAGKAPLVLMCAEAVPWRCHRSLIADALTVRGLPVEHLLGPGRSQPHRLTPFARVAGATITYPPE
jgi:uncharacterized protein (DUF488 family)